MKMTRTIIIIVFYSVYYKTEGGCNVIVLEAGNSTFPPSVESQSSPHGNGMMISSYSSQFKTERERKQRVRTIHAFVIKGMNRLSIQHYILGRL